MNPDFSHRLFYPSNNCEARAQAFDTCIAMARRAISMLEYIADAEEENPAINAAIMEIKDLVAVLEAYSE